MLPMRSKLKTLARCQPNEGNPNKKPEIGPELFKWGATTSMVPRRLESMATQKENISPQPQMTS
jgi:hypothetical protein